MSGPRELLLGLDVGTTATKARAFDLEGHVVAGATRAYDLLTPQPGWVEQNPEELWSAIVQTVREVTTRISPHDHIVALSQASQGGTTIPVDAAGAPVHNAISWMDRRAATLSERTAKAFGTDYVQTTTGWPLSGALSLHHIAWLREHRPGVFSIAKRFLFINDFITHGLTGEAVMNPSDGTMTQLLDIEQAEWDPQLLDYAGIDRAQLSEVRPSGEVIGTVLPETARLLGLPDGVVVVNGAHDQYCAAIGTGVTIPGEILLSCGTAWVVLAVPDSLAAGRSSGIALSCHAIQGRWGGIRSLGGIGTSLEWLVNQVWCDDASNDRADRYQALNTAAAGVPAGSRGLAFVPLSGGHQAGREGGGFLHLTLAHTRDEMSRAVMEGITYELRRALEEIRQGGITVDRLTMVGGAAESPIWPQIVADVTGLPVIVPQERQAAAAGAAILAGVGIGRFAGPEEGFAAFRGNASELAPNPGDRSVYDLAYRDYHRLCNRLAEFSTSTEEGTLWRNPR